MIPVKAKQSQYVSGALGRWIAPVLSLALVLTGLMISQPARASEGADVVWSLGADCRVPLDGDGAHGPEAPGIGSLSGLRDIRSQFVVSRGMNRPPSSPMCLWRRLQPQVSIWIRLVLWSINRLG